ncbi:hypothetical protein LMH73_024550 [Vibrio splendidus]|nr:hypothetical protein [Vibrio splendidus]MCC4881485.1 hypothetical protein [Vibrio splendidus]
MDVVRYVFSDHAIKRFKKRFPGLTLEEETETLTPCKTKDFGFLSGTLSYKRIKKSERHKYRFLVSDNGAYFICKAMVVIEGVEPLKVITVLRNDQDDGFQSMMYEHALRLLEAEREQEANKANQEIFDLQQEEADKKEHEKAQNQKRRELDYEKASQHLFESEHFGFLLEYKETLLDVNVNRYCSILHTASTLYRSYSHLRERIESIGTEIEPEFSKRKELASIAAKVEKAITVRELPVHLELEDRWKESVNEIINEYLRMELLLLNHFYETDSKISAYNRDAILVLFGVVIRYEDGAFIKQDVLSSIASYMINYEMCVMSEIYSGKSFSGNGLLQKIAHLNYLARLPFVTDDMKGKLHNISSFYDVVLDRMIDLGIDDHDKISMANLDPSFVPSEPLEEDDTITESDVLDETVLIDDTEDQADKSVA